MHLQLTVKHDDGIWLIYFRRYKSVRSMLIVSPEGKRKSYCFLHGAREVELIDRKFLLKWSTSIAQIAEVFPSFTIYDCHKHETFEEWVKANLADEDVDSARSCRGFPWLPVGSEISVYMIYKQEIDSLLNDGTYRCSAEVVELAGDILKSLDDEEVEHHTPDGLLKSAMFRMATSMVAHQAYKQDGTDQ